MKGSIFAKFTKTITLLKAGSVLEKEVYSRSSPWNTCLDLESTIQKGNKQKKHASKRATVRGCGHAQRFL